MVLLMAPHLAVSKEAMRAVWKADLKVDGSSFGCIEGRDVGLLDGTSDGSSFGCIEGGDEGWLEG